MPPPDSIRNGERAPAFSLPTVNREGAVSLGDYRGHALLLGSIAASTARSAAVTWRSST